MHKTGLGSGLEEIVIINSEKTKSYDEKGNLNKGVEELNLDELIPNKNQPRKVFDEDALNELAESIKTHGVLQPILVTKVGNKYQIVAGERRYRASKIAGLNKVPVIIRDLTVQQVKEIALIENLQRADLNAIEEAQAYQTLITEFDLTQEQLAERLGKSRPAITNALRLLTLNPVVVDMVSTGRLSAGHARALAAIKDTTVQASYAVAACDKQMSVRQLELMVSNYLNPNKPQKKIKPVLSSELKDLANDMLYVFGTKIKIAGTNNKGRICIDYFSQNDLNRIFDIIKKMKEL